MIFKLSEKNNGKIVTDRMVSLKAKGLYFFLMHLDLEKDYSIEAIASCNDHPACNILCAVLCSNVRGAAGYQEKCLMLLSLEERMYTPEKA